MTIRKINLTEKMVVYTLILAMPAMIWFGSYVWISARDAIMERTFQQLIAVRVEKQQSLEHYLHNLINEVERFSKSEKIGPPPEGVNELLINKWDGQNLPFFDTGNDTILLWEKPVLPVEKKAPLYVLVIKPGKEIMQFAVDKNGLNQLMVNKNPYSGLGKTGEAYLTGSDTLMRTTSRFQQHSILQTLVTTKGISDAMQGITSTGVYTDYRGIEILGSYAPFVFNHLRWAIVAEIDSQEALMPVVALGRNILLLGIFAMLAIFMAVWIAARKITRPLIRLRDAAEKIAEGDYAQVIENKSGDETGALTESFNQMAHELLIQSRQLNLERLNRMQAMIDGQEMERKRLAREIHDSLGQTLLAVNMLLDRTKECQPDEVHQFTLPASGIVKDAVGEVRAIINNIRPPALTELGLAEALRNLCRDAALTGDMSIETHLNPPPLPDNVATYLYRIAQEALQNILKHAKASHALLRLGVNDNLLTMTIQDNGRGFNQTHLPSGSNGLTNIRDRMQILGGDFEIITAPSNGTTLTVKLFLSHE